MASRVITLTLDGSPTIDDYLAGLNALRQLVADLSEDFAEGEQISWVLDSLEVGSAITAVRGEATNYAAVERVADAYLGLGRAIVENDRARLHVYSPRVQGTVLSLTKILGQRVPTIRMETADDDVTIVEPPSDYRPTRLAVPDEGSYGAVEGRIQTLSSRSNLRFTLYDLVWDRPVTCYLAQGDDHGLRELWDKLAIVEGWVKRDPATGRPQTIRRITRINPIEPQPEDAWLGARGAIPGEGAPPAEVIIRELRDAQ